jgi:aminoglycoside 2'-N-acetyltransferase I
MNKPNELQVAIARTEELTSATRQAIIQVCYAAFQQEDFLNLFSYFPAGGRHFLAYCGDEVVSHAVVTTRWLQPASLPLLKTAYVDAVATDPIYQDQGYCSLVMQTLARNISDYEIACLQTDIPEFYSRLGWQRWRGSLAGRDKDGLVPTPDEKGVMILRLSHTPPLDLDSLLTIEVSGRIW